MSHLKEKLIFWGVGVGLPRETIFCKCYDRASETEQPLPTCTIRVAYNGIQEGNLLLAYPDIYFKTLGVLEELNNVITRMNSAASVKQHAEAYRAILAICIKNYEELKNEDRHFEQSPLKEFPHFLHTFREEHESLLKSIATGLDGLRQVNYHGAGIGNEVRDAAEQLEHIIANWGGACFF